MPNVVAERREQMFPRLTPAQLARLGELGSRRRVECGELLFDQGSVAPQFYVVISGALEIVQPADGKELPIIVHGPGEFTGEVNMLSGRRSFVRGRMRDSGELLVITPEVLR